jgi:hypothetical protein
MSARDIRLPSLFHPQRIKVFSGFAESVEVLHA